MKRLAIILSLVAPMAFAHNITVNNTLPSIEIKDKGELVLNNGQISHKTWQSTQLQNKVYMIHHVAGRSAAKEVNAPMIEAIKAAKLPEACYQTVNIVNAGDAIWGTSSFVKSSVEDSKKEFPWSAFIVDSTGVAQKAWDFTLESSAIVLLDKQGKVLFVKDGALTQPEIDQVMGLIQSNLNCK